MCGHIEVHGLRAKRKEITYSIDAEGVADAKGPAIERTVLLVAIVLPELLNHVARRTRKFDLKKLTYQQR